MISKYTISAQYILFTHISNTFKVLQGDKTIGAEVVSERDARKVA